MAELKFKNLVGKKIRIVRMKGEPMYTGKEGVIEKIDDAGQLHGTWGWLAIQPENDEFEVSTESAQKREVGVHQFAFDFSVKDPEDEMYLDELEADINELLKLKFGSKLNLYDGSVVNTWSKKEYGE